MAAVPKLLDHTQWKVSVGGGMGYLHFWTYCVFLVLLSAVAVETWIKPGVFNTDYSSTVV